MPIKTAFFVTLIGRDMNKRSTTALMTLYNGLFDLLEEVPFDKITVRGICAKTKVNKMTFYKYHTDKFDVLSKAFRAKFNEDFTKRFGPGESLLHNRDFEPAVYEIVHFLFEWCKRYNVQLRNLFTSANQMAYDIAKSMIFKDYYEYLSHAIDFSRFDVTPTYLSSFLFGGFIATMEAYLRALRSHSDIDAVEKENDQFCRFLAHYLTVTLYEPTQGACVK